MKNNFTFIRFIWCYVLRIYASRYGCIRAFGRCCFYAYFNGCFRCAFTCDGNRRFD